MRHSLLPAICRFVIMAALLCPCRLPVYADLNDGLVHHWPLDGNAHDVVGSTHGTVVGDPAYTTGLVSRSLRFDGLDDYLQFDTAMPPDTDHCTLSFWVRPEPEKQFTQAIISSRAPLRPSSPVDFIFDLHPWSMVFPWHISDGGIGYTGGDRLDYDTWTHIAILLKQKQVLGGFLIESDFFVNGDRHQGDDFGPPYNYHDEWFFPLIRVGALVEPDGGDLQFFQGRIDDIRLYDRLLQDEEIDDLVAAGVAAEHPVENPQPTNGASLVDADGDLSWSEPPEPFAQHFPYKVLLDTAEPPTTLQGTIAVSQRTTFPLPRLDYETTYYWQILRITPAGDVPGPVWSFTTAAGAATTPSPANGAGSVELSAQLSWTPYAHALSHTVYFGTDSPPTTLLAQGLKETTVDPGPLDYATTYYWRVDEEVATAPGISTGPIWSFTTTLPGSGTAEDPYRIARPRDLEILSRKPVYWSGHRCFVLTDDLVLPPDMRLQPIGDSDHPFDGVFDGQGHSISGLTMPSSATSNNCGLFGQTAFNAVIHHLSVLDARLTFKWRMGGILVAINEGEIAHCNVSGSIVGAGMDENMGYMGLLVGNNQDRGRIHHCSSTGSVLASSPEYLAKYAGGLLAINYGQITNCYSTAVVRAEWGCGGLVGKNQGQITDCYATGTVVCDNYSGGLVGENRGQIGNCYAAGFVLSDHDSVDVGGFVGSMDAGSCSGYFDTQLSPPSPQGCGTGRTTAQMMSQPNFVGWDFDTVWGIDQGRGYPFLRWQRQGPCGSAAEPYPRADLNHDCRVNLLDFQILAETWMYIPH